MANRNFISSVFMVAGCSMGAGCLAMPLLAAGPNFIFSAIFIIISGIFSYFLATASLEIFILYKNDVNVSSIVEKNFGRGGVIVTGILNGMLMYALLSAYMAGGVDLLHTTVLPRINIHLPSSLTLLLFVAIFMPIFFKGANLVISSNKLVFYLKLTMFVIALGCGVFFLSPRITNLVVSQSKYIGHAWPVFFGALWFHFIIPVIAKVHNYDRKQCRRVFKVGLILPVVLYILWVAVMLSLVAREGTSNSFYNLLASDGSVGMMINYAMNDNAHIPSLMKLSLNLFSNLALLTSFLTVGLSTYDYIRDALHIKQTRRGILNNLTLTMMPPVIIALFFPDGFVFIVQQAIILLMLTSAIVIACVLKDYNRLERKPTKVLLYGLIAGLIFLITLQLLDNFDKLPKYGIN
jgi:tyrosine-specific transport protein